MAEALNKLNALGIAFLDILFVLDILLITLADGRELRYDRFADSRFEIAVALAVKVMLDLLIAQSRDCGVDGHQVVDAVLALGIAHLRFTVGDRALELLHDDVIVVGEQDIAVGVLVALAHLGGGILQAHDAGAVLGNEALGNLEHVAVHAVEAVGDIAGQLEVLHLVRADRHLVRLIEQDIARHQARVGEETRVDVIGVLCAFILELGHAGKLAELGVAVEDPSHHRVIGIVALDEEGRLLDVDAARHDKGVHIDNILAECGGILAHGDRVQVSQRINTVILRILLHFDPVFDSAEVVAEGDGAAGLDRGEYDLLLFGSVFHNIKSFFN